MTGLFIRRVDFPPLSKPSRGFMIRLPRALAFALAILPVVSLAQAETEPSTPPDTSAPAVDAGTPPTPSVPGAAATPSVDTPLAEPAVSEQDIFALSMDLDRLHATPVYSAGRTEQRVDEAPSVMSVVNRQTMRT